MAIYHCQVQIISRGKGKSSIAAAAYRSGEKLVDKRTGIIHDYTRKQGVEFNEIMAPSYAPNWVNNRSKLWNEVEKIEKSKNSQLAREINIALPTELSKKQQKQLIIEYVKDNFVNKGMVADIAIHDKNDGNPHAHIMLTVRKFNEDGTWGSKARKEYILDKNGEKIKKNNDFKSRKIETTDWNKKETMLKWKENWAIYANKALEKVGCEERIDHRSYKEQGINQIATIHLGKNCSEMQKKGIENPRTEINNQIKELNQKKVIALQEYRELKIKLGKELENEKVIAKKYSNLTQQEKAVIQESEEIMGVSQLTYQNSKKTLNTFDIARKDYSFKLFESRTEIRKNKDKLCTINNSLNKLKTASGELDGLSKNFLGWYKDKSTAERLKLNIEKYNSTLSDNGYMSNADIKSIEIKIDEIQTVIDKYEHTIKIIGSTSNLITAGVKALKGKELKDFRAEYKKQFPQANYLNFYDMKAIKAVDELVGRPVLVSEIKEIYNKNNECCKKNYKEIETIWDNNYRLIDATKELSIVEKYKDVADKWDTKVFGRAKFQREHINDRMLYDNAKDSLKTYCVKDNSDLISQERINKNNINIIIPSLQAKIGALEPYMKVLRCGLDTIHSAERTAKFEEHKLQASHNFKSKSKVRSNDYDLER